MGVVYEEEHFRGLGSFRALFSCCRTAAFILECWKTAGFKEWWDLAL